MDGESEADTQRAEAGRAEANVQREGLGSHEPARVNQPNVRRGDTGSPKPARIEKRQAEACPTKGAGRVKSMFERMAHSVA